MPIFYHFRDITRSATLKIDMTSYFFCWGWSDLDKISQTGAEWHVDCGDMVRIEARCRTPIWRTFLRIPWHVIPQPPATLQGAATWWNHCHDSRATCTLQGAVTWRNQCHDRATLQGVIIPSAILKTFFAIFYIFGFLMQFGLWRAAAFVSSSIDLLFITRYQRVRDRRTDRRSDGYAAYR